MRAFIVLCLVALATADKLGYNYSPVSHSDGNYGRGESNLAEPVGDHFDGVGSDHVGSVSDVGDSGYEKEFYSFSANDADFDQPDASNDIANAVKKNLQVVFVKGPENKGLEDAALSLAKHAGDQRTAVYVLNKQADIGELANRLNQENSHNRHKPEVHFVKYRTPEDAHNAQSQIQNQYAALGGPSQSHDGGVAPVLDFASRGHSVSAGGHEGHLGGDDFSGAQSAQSGLYLPPSLRRFIK